MGEKEAGRSQIILSLILYFLLHSITIDFIVADRRGSCLALSDLMDTTLEEADPFCQGSLNVNGPTNTPAESHAKSAVTSPPCEEAAESLLASMPVG
jgi:hypothetical protein